MAIEMEGDQWKDKARSLQLQLRQRFRVAVDRRPTFSDDGYISTRIQLWIERFRSFRRDSLPSSPNFYLKRVSKDIDMEEDSALTRMLQAVAVPVIGNVCHVFMHGLNRVQVYGAEKLHQALLHRPSNKPLITVSNHVASLDDPLVIAALIPPSVLLDAHKLRWTLCASDRCFGNTVTSAFFKHVKVLPLTRGEGIYQKLMILVDDAGDEWPMIGHAPWNGCHLADFVMPFFLFIVGMAIALALKRIPDRHLAIRKVILRTVKLVFFGLLLQGGFSHAPDELTYGVDMQRIRWCGILQRIALAYLVVALIEILTRSATVKDIPTNHFLMFKSYIWHWLLGACVLILYLAVLYGTYVPDWHFMVDDENSVYYGKIWKVSCNVRGKLDPPCNAVGYIDREVMGISHMYHKPAWKRSKACTRNSPYEGALLEDAPSWCWAHFEPEGILSSISAILSTVIGVHFGHILIHIKDHSTRLKHWIVMGLSLLLFGIILHVTHAIPLNKQLYTLSYICVTSGAAALIFSTFYILVDILKLKYVFLPFEWIGMNAMLVYVMAAEGIFVGFINGWYYKSPHNTLIYWIKKHIFIGVWHSRRVGILLYVICAEILFWALVAAILHWLGIYWKL